MSKFKRIISFVLTVVMMLGVINISAFAAEKTTPVQTKSGRNMVVTSGEVQPIEIEEANYSIPKEAVLNEGYKSPYTEIVYVDYTLKGVRFIDEYLPDGQVRNTTTDGYLIISNLNGLVESMPIPEVETYEMDEEIRLQIRDAVENGGDLSKINGITVNTIGNTTIIEEKPKNSLAAASIDDTTKEAIYPVEDTFPSYNAKKVKSSTKYISSLGVNRVVNVYETQDYYAYIHKDFSKFLVGTTVAAISAAVSWPLSTVEAMLAGFGWLSSAGELLYNILFVTSSDMEYWFAVESGIYDSTKEHAEINVTTDSMWGTFEYGYGRDYQPCWIATEVPWPYEETRRDNYASFVNTAANNYDSVINAYGEWIAGKGEFGK